MNDLTITPPPTDNIVTVKAALALQRLGKPANGTFLSAAEALVEDGKEVTDKTLAIALHEPA